MPLQVRNSRVTNDLNLWENITSETIDFDFGNSIPLRDAFLTCSQASEPSTSTVNSSTLRPSSLRSSGVKPPKLA